MSQRVKTLDEIRDSRILFEKKVPPFGLFIIIVIMIALGGLTYWAYITPKESVIKSQGIVQSVDKNYVMAPYSGEIVSTDYEEGKVVKEGDVLFTIKSTDLDVQLNQLTSQKEVYKKYIENYNKLVDCIKNETNSFNADNKDESLFYNKYEAYKGKIDQMVVDTKQLETFGYSKEQIDEEIKKNDSKKEQVKYAELDSIDSSIAEYNSQISSIDIQIESINMGKKEYQVEATTSGKIHVMTEYKEGMVIQAGTTVASIAANSDELEVVATVSEAQAVNIKEGDKVDMTVSGLTQSFYGTISGEVVSKDTDVTVSNSSDGSASTFFKIVVKPDCNYVISKSGEKVLLGNGMNVETRITNKKITYFYYVLEALGVTAS